MIETAELAARFETNRTHLRGVAFRMLGSATEADDAVQEAWLRLSRVDPTEIVNLGGWLTTVVSRICLDQLRARSARREEVNDPSVIAGRATDGPIGGPEDDAVLADSVGRALLVVLDRLGPEERIAFVLHDMLAVPFAQIAPLVSRSPVATKKLASRARQRVRGVPHRSGAQVAVRRRVVDAFVAAARVGDIDAILAVLDPDVVRRAEVATVGSDRPSELRGASQVAREIALFGSNARHAEPALIDGDVGVLIAPYGRLALVLSFAIEDDRITAYELIADPSRLDRLELAMLPDSTGHRSDSM